MSFFKLILPIAFACLFNALANTAWKMFLLKHPFTFDLKALTLTFSSPLIILGVFFYVSSMLLFFYLLSNYNLSIVIPLTSLTYVFNLLAAHYVFKESLSVQLIVGTLIIILGIVIVANPQFLNSK